MVGPHACSLHKSGPLWKTFEHPFLMSLVTNTLSPPPFLWQCALAKWAFLGSFGFQVFCLPGVWTCHFLSMSSLSKDLCINTPVVSSVLSWYGFMIPELWRLDCISCESIGSNAECLSSAVATLYLVTGVRANWCDPLPVGVGHRLASPLRSSRSLSSTTRSWKNETVHRFLHPHPYWFLHSILPVFECYSMTFFCLRFNLRSHLNSFLPPKM